MFKVVPLGVYPAKYHYTARRKTSIFKQINNLTIKEKMFNFPLPYLFVNTYTGESKWLSLEEGSNLDEDWEQDPTQKPIPVYPENWI